MKDITILILAGIVALVIVAQSIKIDSLENQIRDACSRLENVLTNTAVKSEGEWK
jgi:hypothetical protein